MSIDYYLNLGSSTTGYFIDSPIVNTIPFALNMFATLYPKGLRPLTKRNLGEEEQEKFSKIEGILKRVCKNLEVDHHRVTLALSSLLGRNVAAMGTNWSIGGPMIVLGSRLFESYNPEAEDIEQEGSEYSLWIDKLKALGDIPSELGLNLDRLTPIELDEIKKLAIQFKNSCTREELESLLAKEVIYAKHHHLLQAVGINVLFGCVSTFVAVLAVIEGLVVSKKAFSWGTLPVMFLVLNAISRYNIRQSNKHAATSHYCKGFVQYHKKKLINELFDKDVVKFSEKIEGMLKQIDLLSPRPNHAKLLKYSVEQIKPELLLESPKEIRMTKTARTLMGCGLCTLLVASIATLPILGSYYYQRYYYDI